MEEPKEDGLGQDEGEVKVSKDKLGKKILVKKIRKWETEDGSIKKNERVRHNLTRMGK